MLSVSRRFRMLSISTENVAQQSNLFAAVNAVSMLSVRKTLFRIQIYLMQSDLFAAINVVCEQAISYAEHKYGNSAQQSDLFAAVNAVC